MPGFFDLFDRRLYARAWFWFLVALLDVGTTFFLGALPMLVEHKFTGYGLIAAAMAISFFCALLPERLLSDFGSKLFKAVRSRRG
jgi:hypothetical protein